MWRPRPGSRSGHQRESERLLQRCRRCAWLILARLCHRLGYHHVRAITAPGTNPVDYARRLVRNFATEVAGAPPELWTGWTHILRRHRALDFFAAPDVRPVNGFFPLVPGKASSAGSASCYFQKVLPRKGPLKQIGDIRPRYARRGPEVEFLGDHLPRCVGRYRLALDSGLVQLLQHR
jgi:hypothetical protein